ncbi:sensor histidine kinase [Termitidicoccus mucosus]|uniref:Histidine kinase domain-containing protein n=1 Tax=Termitidicoccus mucosus TaxID=1184151 RepID=A0A178IH06_9BACT|nr:hypothetical protein AW736_19180 [Opitutaceae bacterium TSB47]
MKTDKKIQFEKHYQAALRCHLRQRAHGRSAGSIGRTAVSLGLDTLDLARMHDRAVALQPPSNAGHDGHPSAQAGAVFFFQVMEQVEHTHQPARAATLHAQHIDAKLHARTAALAAARQQVRRETARRKKGERQLVQGARHYSQLLAQSRRLAHQVLSAQEEERKEISRELHDEVAQILAGINVQLAALQESAAINSRSLRQRIAQTQRLVGQSIRIVHRYARELRPAMLDDLGLIPALRSYIKDLPGRKGLLIRFTVFPGVEALNNTRRTVLYRVAQEALTNVARHARARLVTVRVLKIADSVRLEIRDDGRSFQVDRALAAKNNKHLGLIGMRERVEMVGGRFVIKSVPGKGTTVRAEIPFRGRQRRPAL